MHIDDKISEALTAAFLDPAVRLGHGVGSSRGERCTIAEVNLILTGALTDDPHPCVSEVIRNWVINTQDAMPEDMLNAPAWRRAAVGIAGSAADEATEGLRVQMLLAWMWEALADEAVLFAVPASARRAWDMMLSERTSVAARAAAAYVVCVAAAARAVAGGAYWERRDPAAMLVKLIEAQA